MANLTLKEFVKRIEELDTQDQNEFIRNLGTGSYVEYVGYDIDRNEIVIS